VLGLRCTHGGGERRVSPTQRDVRIVTAGAICGVQHSPTERTLTTLRRNDRREQGTTARWMSDGGTGTHLGPAMCQMQARPAGCPARVSVVQHSAPRALRRARPHTTHRCTHIMQHPPAVAAECACPTLSTGRDDSTPHRRTHSPGIQDQRLRPVEVAQRHHPWHAASLWEHRAAADGPPLQPSLPQGVLVAAHAPPCACGQRRHRASLPAAPPVD
jgi:hypothetical protein